MKLFICFLTICFVLPLLVFPMQAQAKRSFGVALSVNDQAISHYDVDSRAEFLMISGGMQQTKANKEKARSMAINGLIDEALKIQEAEKYDLTVSDEEVAEGFANIAKQNRMSNDEFKALLKKQGIDSATMMKQIRADITWRNYITAILRPKINVSENDINARLDRMKKNIGKQEYQLSEIILSVLDQKKQGDIQSLAKKIVTEIRAKRAPFPAVAMKFSSAPSASSGGSLGWVSLDYLPQEQKEVVEALKKGQVSDPFKTLSGYMIMQLNDVRIISEETLPSQDDILNQVGLQRLTRLQQRTLDDLRSAALIEYLD